MKKITMAICFSYLLFKIFFMTCFAHEHHEHDEHEQETTEVKLSPQTMQENGIKLAKVEAKKLNQQLEVVGEITLNRDAMAYIYPRYAGIVKTLKKNLGDNVQAGEVLATIESNESLQAYELRSPIAGTIVKKNAIQGELVKEDKPIYEVANLNTVWVDLSVYCKDALCIRAGQPVMVSAHEGQLQENGTIDYVAPIGIEDNQTMLARVVLPNTQRQWVPGMYVDASITTQQKEVTMAVNRGAIQKIEDNPVVFVQLGNVFKAIPVKLGLADKNFVEILSGLSTGQNYVSENSFILKADLKKSEADHED